MNYFVAEDVVHIRLSDDAGFVSICGYEYAPIAVEWADEFEPEAWPACEDCMTAQEPAESSDDVIAVQGVYALADDAHLLIGRDGTAWLSLCGRNDQDDSVCWAGHEWPEAYDECPECAAMVHSDLWATEGPNEAAQTNPAEPGSLAKRISDYRLWVVAIDGIEHRPRDETLLKAMCGAKLGRGDAQRKAPMGGPAHCHACDRAVGQVRAATRPRQRIARPKRSSARSPKKTGNRAQTPPKTRRIPAGTKKEIALYGRRMIVPVRFVRGGLPGHGRRH